MHVISHSASRSGAPMVLLHFLDWIATSTSIEVDVALMKGGALEVEFERFDARMLGGVFSRLWAPQRGLHNLGLRRSSAALAMVRQAPTMWAGRRAPLLLLNSVASMPVLRFRPRSADGTVVVYVHELDTSFDRNVGTAMWDLLAPRVDHFIGCSAGVAEMLIERRGIDPARVSVHHGFIDGPHGRSADGAAARRRLGIPADALVVGASGSIEERKGPEVFVRLARDATVLRPDLDLHFVWLGGASTGGAVHQLRHDVHAAGLAARFHHQSETDVPSETMAAFDCFALTSREDAYPLTMLEAASLGIPTVSFDSGGASEFAAAGGSEPLARIVSYLDVGAMAAEVLWLLTDDGARRHIGGRARDHVHERHVTAVAAPRLLDTLIGLQPAIASGRSDEYIANP
jgi:glycosyltransferase involved in cell wall biosynthesis